MVGVWKFSGTTHLLLNLHVHHPKGKVSPNYMQYFVKFLYFSIKFSDSGEERMSLTSERLSTYMYKLPNEPNFKNAIYKWGHILKPKATKQNQRNK